MKSILSALLIVWLWSATTNAGSPPTTDYVALLNEAVAAIDDDYRHRWAFTETSVTADRTTVGRYDPRRSEGERWLLLSINGRDPGDEEIAEFAAEKSREHAASDDGKDEGVSSMVEPDSLRLLEETIEYWLFSFVPDEDEEEFVAGLDGTLRIRKQGRYLELIDIRSTRPFKPAFGVSIREFLTRLTFGPAAPGGPVVPRSVNFSVDARAFVVKRVRETVSTTFSDYQKVGE